MPHPGETKLYYKAIVFDLDGVLIDSHPVHVAAWQRVLGHHGIELTEEQQARCIGLTSAAFGRLVRDEWNHAIPVSLEHLIQQKRATYFELAAQTLREIAGASRILARLAVQRPLALCSMASRSQIGATLTNFGWYDYFRLVLGGESVTHAKPDPAIYLAAQEYFALPAAEILVFEDSPVGVQAACRAGMPVVGIETNHSAGDLMAHGAVATLRDFEDALLEQILHRGLMPGGERSPP
jgi:HAD superfamily hydrolase (TIGR01509 family)